MSPACTLSDLIRPAQGAKHATVLRDIILVVAGSLFVAVCAKVQAPTWPVPMTLQPFAVLLVGAALGSRRGSLAILAYLAEGASGLPVFATAPFGGAAYLLGPTAGYLLGFVPAAFVVGLLAERRWDRRFVFTLAAMAIGQSIILACGFAWMAVGIGAKAAIASGVAPFIVGDCLKIALAAVALPGAWRILRMTSASTEQREE
jgi:biotin transport system substrate-specific component